MARATRTCLEAMGVRVLCADTPQDAVEAVQAGLAAAFGAGEAVTVLLSQRLIGRKDWERTR